MEETDTGTAPPRLDRPDALAALAAPAAPDALAALAETLRRLHHDEMLVLPNAWDAASARVVEDSGFPAVATTSAATAAMLGYPDGEKAPREAMFAAAARIAAAVSVPVTMDAEAGYGLAPADLVRSLTDIGVVGCNLEDTDHRRGGLTDAEDQATWLSRVRDAADEIGVPVVINARIDVFLPGSPVPEDRRVDEAVRRGRLYRTAGADCLYPIGVGDPEILAELVAAIDGPVNGNPSPQLTLPVLRRLGVARASYGPRFYRTALADFGRSITRLQPVSDHQREDRAR